MSIHVQKRGKNSFLLVVNLGYDESGRKIRKTKTVKCDDLTNLEYYKKVFYENTTGKPYIKEMSPINKSDLDNEYGYLYLVQQKGTPYYKIGITKDIKRRLSSFKTAIPKGINILSTILIYKYKHVERRLHQEFKTKNINGEWFELDETDLNKFYELIIEKF